MNLRSQREGGSIILFLIIIIAVLCGGYYFLTQLRENSKREGEQFVRTFIERVVIGGDLKYFHSIVDPERSIVINPGKEQEFVETCRKLGQPLPGYDINGTLTFAKYFFSPEGNYKTILTYPDRHASLSLNVGRPSGMWVLHDFGITWERPMD